MREFQSFWYKWAILCERLNFVINMVSDYYFFIYKLKKYFVSFQVFQTFLYWFRVLTFFDEFNPFLFNMHGNARVCKKIFTPSISYLFLQVPNCQIYKTANKLINTAFAIDNF